MPKISIILPTYNVEPYIERALQSCINQTFKDIEIIVVDDCGNDKSIEIAKDYAKKDERIKIIHNKENLKLLRARYEGVKAAISDYIMFLDPDDYLELNACEECVKVLDEKKNIIDIIFFNCFIVDNNCFSVRELGIDSGFYLKYKFVTKLLKTKNLFWTMWGKVINKELYLLAFYNLKLNNNIKISMAEDALFYYFLICLSKNIFYLNKSLYYYNNMNCNSLTKNKKLLEENLYEHDMVIKIIDNSNFNGKNLALSNLIQYFLYMQKNKMQFKINTFLLLKIKKYLFKFYRIFYILKEW